MSDNEAAASKRSGTDSSSSASHSHDDKNSSDGEDASSESSSSSNDDASKSDDEDTPMPAFPSGWNKQNAGEGDATENLTEEQYIEKTKQWIEQIPVGLGLCPWAAKSFHQDNIRYGVCMEETWPTPVGNRLCREAQHLTDTIDERKPNEIKTLLLICPKINEWHHDVEAFTSFVNDPNPSDNCLRGEVTLVPFHPNYLEWKGLPDGYGVGSTVHVYKPTADVSEGDNCDIRNRCRAVITETETQMFGRRKIR
ncbi:MAG: hypothetical protein SGARI_003890, partial [Bacillariaceae sp.]